MPEPVGSCEQLVDLAAADFLTKERRDRARIEKAHRSCLVSQFVGDRDRQACHVRLAVSGLDIQSIIASLAEMNT